MDLQKAFDEGFDAVKGYVDRTFAQYETRLRELEDRAPLQGEPGRDGADGPSMESVKEMVTHAVAALPPAAAGADGKDADAEAITAKVMAAVMDKVAQIPAAKDGADGKDGKDGVGLADALIDREGALLVTLTNGTVKSLGQVVGKDGQDGAAGNDGADALGFDDLSIEFDGERAFKFVMARGELRKEFGPFTVPAMIWRGIYVDGTEYKQGDTVTWAGCLWVCQTDSSSKPDNGSGDWRMAVRKGKDGKDGTMKAAREPAPVRIG